MSGAAGRDGVGCFTEEYEDRYEFICGEQVRTLAKPKDGVDGLQGQQGATGATGAAGPQGEQGAVGETGAQGNPGDVGQQGGKGDTGETGTAGPGGSPGSPGQGCTVQQQVNGALITCGVSSVLVTNGINGEDGEDLAAGDYSIAEIIDPCGATPGVNEILLKLGNGKYVAWYQSVGNVVLPPGSYHTTDASSCPFTIAADGSYHD